MRGSPIRKSSDQRSVDSSPRLIAASYVLHRLLVPRHPPCALNNLATQKHRTPTPGRKRACGPTRTLQIRVLKDARVHCAVLNVRPDTDPTPPPDLPNPTGRAAVRQKTGPAKTAVARSLRTQQRAYEPVPGIRTPVHAHPRVCRTGSPRREPAELVSVPPSSTVPDTSGHPVVGDRHGPSTALDHHTGVAASAP